MSRAGSSDIFDRARGLAVAGLIAAGAAAIVGALLDWVSISDVPPNPTGAEARREVAERSIPFSGVEEGDGQIVIVFGALLIVLAIVLLVRRRALFAGLAFVASIVIGAIGISDYRAIGDRNSQLIREMELVGNPDPGVGITLVAAAGILGIVAAAAGLVATPTGERRP
jgi:hypothetical protein